MKVTFPYLGQAHQVLHSLPIAAALAQRHAGIAVHVCGVDQGVLDFAQRMVARHAPAARIQFDRLALGPGDGLRLAMGLGRRPFKQYALARNRGYFAGCDAVVTPERTSLFLRQLGVKARLIWTRHGAGDRKIGFARDVVRFDYVLMAGRKIEQRLLQAGLIRPGRYLSGVYAKFDWAQAPGRGTLFDNDRPTVLYNPHFDSRLSSWHRLGRAALDALAASTRYNLIFAPHVRLFPAPTEGDYAHFAAWRGLPHVHIDLGSQNSIDMSYTGAADLYLGDVSSQVAEFVSTPRPCLFLDAHGVDWRSNPNYRSWALGDVLDSAQGLEARIDQAIARHADFLSAQQHYLEETFDLPPGEPSAGRAADAIADYLHGPA